MRERRDSPRVELECGCTLSRRFGAPVQGRTVDVGPGGMRVATQRPLSTDEVLEFELPPPTGPGVRGRARVLRQQPYGVYALRFERLSDEARAALAQLAG
jgi:PilZ domain-containing protein